MLHSQNGHQHNQSFQDLTVRRLIYSIFLNLAITLSEIIGGILSNSLSLISDALHNLMDTFSMVVSLFARIVSKKPISRTKTFGYKRAEIIAAFININGLIIISFFLFKEAFHRLFNPVEINGTLMFVVALIGLAGNAVSAALLYRSSKENINIRSSFVHILSDAFSSVGVIIAGIFIMFGGWFFLDAVLAFIIGTYVLIQSWHMLNRVIHILMQGTPASVDIDSIKDRLEKIDGVRDIHHIHVWSLTENMNYFEAHVSIEKCDLENMEEIKRQIKTALHSDFNVGHSTIEFETAECCCQKTLQQ